jgi:GR25 family glycosyltransferase involved in LPS biosynthesis
MENYFLNMKTYICHYPKLKERIDYLIPSLNKNNIEDIEIIYGVDRNNIDIKNLSKFSNKRELVIDRLKYTNCPYDYDILSNNEKSVAANFLTHLEIWEKILISEDKYSLVLEDDAIICEDFIENWNRIKNSIPDDLDIAYLHEGCGFTVQNRLGIKPTKESIFYYCWLKESRTCCSYIISKEFCNKILTDLYPIVLGVDHELNYIQKKLNANVYWTSPALFKEGSGNIYKSSIR